MVKIIGLDRYGQYTRAQRVASDKCQYVHNRVSRRRTVSIKGPCQNIFSILSPKCIRVGVESRCCNRLQVRPCAARLAGCVKIARLRTKSKSCVSSPRQKDMLRRLSMRSDSEPLIATDRLKYLALNLPHIFSASYCSSQIYQFSRKSRS